MDRGGCEALACITVTYSPDVEVLRRQLLALPVNAKKILVDNGTPDVIWFEVENAIADIPRLSALRIGKNEGIGRAINIAARSIRSDEGVRRLLLLDQDSIPALGSISMLLGGFDQLRTEGISLGAVGPSLQDPASGARHGFHVSRGMRWSRVYPKDSSPIRCDSLNGSGTLMDLEIFLALGGLDESLFIDHVDTEWSFRLASHGLSLFGIPHAVFVHQMGERTARLWMGRWIPVPMRAPRRHAYLFRNTVLLLKRRYVPFVWKAWAVVKLAVTAIVTSLAGPARKDQINWMAIGLFAGVRGKTGPI